METNYLVWTAIELRCPGAGAYVGFAPESEHELIARKLDQRQARVYGGGTLTVRQDRLSPLHYYAVRDPSSVKVKPVDRPPAPDGTRHVSLIFGFSWGAAARPAEAAAGPPCDDDAVKATAEGLMKGLPSFLITVGLPMAHEEEFHQKVVCADPRQTLNELCRRVTDVGRILG